MDTSTMQQQWEREFEIVDDWQIRRFAEIIRDSNPLHHNEAAAKQEGLRGIIAPGVMVVGFVSSTIAGEIPCVKVRGLELRFKNPLYAGARPLVVCTISSSSKDSGNFVRVAITVYSNPDRSEVAAIGFCSLILPT